jgi:hypothetical protein
VEGKAMKKPKRPKLVVDNKLPDEPTEEFTYEEFRVYAEQLNDLHARYPELQALMMRAHKNKDQAMMMAYLELLACYDDARDYLAEKKREELSVVKKKR